MSRPLAVEVTDALPLIATAPADRAVLTRAPGDTLQLYYQLWLFRDGLVGPTPFLQDPYEFRVDGPRWNGPQTFLPLALPFVLLSPLGTHVAYNLLVVLSFPLSGLAGFALARQYGASGFAAATAGAVFALAPARLGPLFGGQPAGFAALCAPLVFWGLDRVLVQGSIWGGLAGGAGLFMLASLEPHYAYVIGALLPAYLAIRGVTTTRPRTRAWAPLLVFAGLGAAGAGWLWMLRQQFLVGSIAESGRSLGEVGLHSPGPAALLAPATYGGVLGILLALVGLMAGASTARAMRCFYATVLVGGLLLSLGPTVPHLHLYEALYRWAPLFALIRNPQKFQLLVSLGATPLVAYGVDALGRRVPPRFASPLLSALLAAAVLETAPWHAIVLTRIPDNPVYGLLRTEARRVLYLPIWPGDSAWSSIYLYNATRTRVPMLNGYSPLVPRRYVTDVFTPLQGLNVGDVSPAAHALLRRLGVTHLALDRALVPPPVSPFPSGFTLERLRTAPGLRLERGADPLWLFGVVPNGLGLQSKATSPVGVFFEGETLPRAIGASTDEASASGGQAAVARAGRDRAGFLAFGPYVLLPAGAYRVTFRTRGDGLRIEVAVDLGQRVLARQALDPSATWQEPMLDFELDRAKPVEFRVFWDGRGEAAVDWVLAVFADRPDPEWTFSVSTLPHRLGERPDRGASAGWASYADPVESARTDLVSGPFRRYPAGRYRLWVRARADAAVAGPLLRLAVTEPAGRVLASRTVAGAELPPGAYREVGLDFELAQPAVVEFPVRYLGGAGVYFDQVGVRPRAGP